MTRYLTIININIYYMYNKEETRLDYNHKKGVKGFVRTTKPRFAPVCKMTKEKYYDCKGKGVCVRCTVRPALQGRVMCKACAEKSAKASEENRQWMKTHGYCYRCGKNRLFGDEKICPECLAKSAEINQKCRSSNHDYYVKDIAILKSKGICRGCRRNKVATGHTYCKTCLIKKRNRSRDYRRLESKSGIDRSERFSFGLCYRCGDPLDTDKRLCSKCCVSAVKNFKGIRGTNAYWRTDNQFLGGMAHG